MNVMLCGANDAKDILPFFNDAAKEVGFKAFNFINGDILYHNYGINKWVRNSKITIHNADVLIFLINSKFGEITWRIEFEEALQNGKNFIVMCNTDTYSIYRELIDTQAVHPKSKKNSNLFRISALIQKLEIEEQITVITFGTNNFKDVLKKHLLNLYRYGISLVEKENRKNSFMPILLSSKLNDIPKKFVNIRNETICKEILFDFFEKKEIRKRAMDYFVISKTLSEDEIIEICLDPEQGVSRKAIQIFGDLLNSRHNLNTLFSEIIPAIANEEVGVVRRAIGSLMLVDLAKSIEYFHLFFPTADVGTPRRIITIFVKRLEDLKALLRHKPKLTSKFLQLIDLCKDFKTDIAEWKEEADLLKQAFERKSRSKTKK